MCLGHLCGCGVLKALLVQQDPSNLSNADAAKEEIDSRKTGGISFMSGPAPPTYKRLRGLMMKHQRVQIAPVAVNAAFCVRDSDSAGRAKSLMPAKTRPHWNLDVQTRVNKAKPSSPVPYN